MTQEFKPAQNAIFEPQEIITSLAHHHGAAQRNWQGVPAIERASNGRLWATWYTGGLREDNDTFVLLVTSDDDGQTWSDPVGIIDPPGMIRAWDPNLWLDPTGKLWWSWTQTCPMPGEAWDGRGGVWVATTDDPTSARPTWSTPRRIADGVALNKPIITSDGTWLWPVTLWWMFEQYTELNHKRKPGVIASTDQGKTWEWRGGAVLDNRVFDEPMIVELADKTLWMLLRTRTGISESFSMDGGISWSDSRPSRFASPSSRFHLRRLKSGRLLLINHLGNKEKERTHLTAMLSEDDGNTWPHRLLLDDREKVSYPDMVEDDQGMLRIIYDRHRYVEKEVLMAKITEADIMAGTLQSSESSLRMLINKAGKNNNATA